MEEYQIVVNNTFESYRKALIRSAYENQQLIDSAGKRLYLLERTCLDNMINRSISTPIAVAETKEELIHFCKKIYGDCVLFDKNGKTPTIEIPMGKASFQIKSVAFVN